MPEVARVLNVNRYIVNEVGIEGLMLDRQLLLLNKVLLFDMTLPLLLHDSDRVWIKLFYGRFPLRGCGHMNLLWLLLWSISMLLLFNYCWYELFCGVE